MSIPVFQFIHPPLPPPGYHKFVFCICDSVSALQISGSIHVAANGIILFLFMDE